jgi:hypothetical protein
MNLAQKIAHNAALRILESQTVPCDRCGRPTGAAGEGICYQCSCEMHACGERDMDNAPWSGPVEMEITESDYEAAAAEAEAAAYLRWAAEYPEEHAAKMEASRKMIAEWRAGCSDSDIPF